MPDQYAALRGTDTLRDRETAIRAQARAERVRNNRAAVLKNIALAGLAGLVGWTAYNNNRRAQKATDRTVVYAVLQPNGEFIASTHYDEVIPPTVEKLQVENALWTYVQARDCYSLSDFVRQAYIAQAMSNERITNALHKEYRLDNPNAPQHVYGDHGITVHCDEVDPPLAIGDAGDLYYFRFRRYEDDGRGHPEAAALAPVYGVTVRYRTGIYPTGNTTNDKRRTWLDPVTFNAPGVQILDSPGATPVSAQPRARPEAHS